MAIMKRSVKGRFRAVDDTNSEGSVGFHMQYTVNICYTVADGANNFRELAGYVAMQ